MNLILFVKNCDQGWLKLYLSGQAYIELKVFDMLGREVSTLVSKEQSAGEYKVKFDGSSLPS